ncbi:B-cell receptor CD22-like [Pholidichthys leucotaenia]
MAALNGSCVTIPCSFDIDRKHETDLDDTCRALFTYMDPVTNKRKTLTAGQQMIGSLREKDCTVAFSPVGPEHSRPYFFRLECNNPLKFSFENSVHILVQADPPSPTVTPSPLRVKEGSSVSLTCSAPAPCLSHPPNLTWTPNLGRGVEALQENQDKTRVQTSVLTFTASHLHHGQKISCSAVYEKQDGRPEVSAETSLTADVHYSPKGTTVSGLPSAPVSEKSKMTLTCNSKANPPARNYSWFRADGDQETLIGTGQTLKTEASTISSPFFCKAENDYGVGRSPNTYLDDQCVQCWTATMPQTVEGLSGSCLTIPCSFNILKRYEINLNNNCKAVWSDKLHYLQLITPKETGDVTNKNCTSTFYNLHFNLSKEYHFRLDCPNLLKYTFTTTAVKVVVKADPPSPTVTPSPLRVKEGSSVSLTCSAPAPCLSHPPTLTWTPNLGRSVETLQENQDKTRVQTSVLTFTASHLHHGQKISCLAVYGKQDGHPDVSAETSLTADVHYAPKDTNILVSPSGPVPEDSTVNLTCNSNANPAVKNYTWYRADGAQETLIGTGPIIIIEGSKVSSNIFCQAQNEFGVGHSKKTQTDVESSEQCCGLSTGILPWSLAAVFFSGNVICLALLCKARRSVKAKQEEDNTYMTLDRRQVESSEYGVISKPAA